MPTTAMATLSMLDLRCCPQNTTGSGRSHRFPRILEYHSAKPFAGAKVNGGTVTMTGRTLTLSSDFKVPDTPDPHWQVVDSKGNTFLLQRLGIKGDKVNTSITLPEYVKDVAKVQIYCAWAEALLGETTFAGAPMTN